MVLLFLTACVSGGTASSSSTSSPSPSTSSTTVAGADVGTAPLWVGTRIADWYSVANSGTGTEEDVVHPVLGDAVKLVNSDVDGSQNAGARLNFQGFGPDRVQETEAWYSATFFVPFFIDGQDNVFQFKQGDGATRRHLWNLGWRPVDGELHFIIRTRLTGSTWNLNGSGPIELAVLDEVVPIGRPFRVDVFRRISTGSDGRYEVRIDGQTVWTFSGPTAADNLVPRSAGNHEWVLSHYLGSWQGTVDPSTSWIFVTDATVTTATDPAGAGAPARFDGTFWDDDGSVHEPAIERLAQAGIVQGCDPATHTFCVDRPITRAEFVTLLVRAFAPDGTPDSTTGFTDVEPTDWFAASVSIAHGMGVVDGYGDGSFRPYRMVGRAEAAAMIVRMVGWAPEPPVGRFADVWGGSWYASVVETLASHGVSQGCDTDPLRFCPTDQLSRGEAASFVSRAMGG